MKVIMTHPLLALSKQEIFNKSVKGLANQNWEMSYSTSSACCQYSMVSEEGKLLHCALGHIDPDFPEGTTPSDLRFFDHITNCCNLNEYTYEEYNNNLVEFLDDLQNCHDFSWEPTTMKENLINFAIKYNLEIPNELS